MGYRNMLAVEISIHALHEESDELGKWKIAAKYISIHALHEESDRRY